MSSELIINSRFYETRVALVENGVVVELHIERDSGRELMGNIYRGRVVRVLPGMQAAFVDISLGRTAFLYVSDVYRDFSDFEQMMLNGSEVNETLDTEKMEDALKKPSSRGGFQIEDLLHEGQSIMVQVSKEPLGNKGARLTSHVSLPGKASGIDAYREPHRGIPKDRRQRGARTAKRHYTGYQPRIIRLHRQDGGGKHLQRKIGS